MSSRRRSLVAALALGGALLATSGSSLAASPLSSLEGFSLERATPVVLGPTAPTQKVTVLVTLGLRNEAGLKAFVARVSDPRSADYGHYLTPAQFNDTIGSETKRIADLIRYANIKAE